MGAMTPQLIHTNTGAMKNAMKAVSRVIRFVGRNGNIYMGEEPAANALTATVLRGSLYEGTLERTAEKQEIHKLLAPVVPEAIFCIGLNYTKHYEELALKLGMAMPTKPVIFMKQNHSV